MSCRLISLPVLAILALSLSLAETNVYFQNDTPHTLTIHVSVTGGLVKGRHWNQTTYEVQPWQKKSLIYWFNRDQGITWGRDFQFTASIRRDGQEVTQFWQWLHGEWIGSRYWYAADGAPHWYDDYQVHSATPDADHTTRFKALATEGYDDLLYVLHAKNMYDELRHNTANDASQLSVLAYNVQLLPTSLQAIGQSVRAAHLAEVVDGFDVLIFSEAFDDDVRGFDEGGDLANLDGTLWGGIRQMYPYRTPIVGKDEGLEQDGGVFIASRWPIEVSHGFVYDESICAASDCLSEKGVMYARILKTVAGESRRYHVFGSHTQADYTGDDNSAERGAQLRQMKAFIDGLGIPSDEPVILGGDLNVIRGTGEYWDMLDTLAAVEPQLYGDIDSYDGVTNYMIDGGARQTLDYLFCSENHLLPVSAEVEVLVFKSASADLIRKDPLRWFYTPMANYSDHYPVYGLFAYPE